MLSELALIARARAFPRFHSQLVLGIDDDAALLQPTGQTLAWSVDTLVENTHFLRQMPPEEIAWKALAVNLSDLAAMNAQPLAALLSLSLPSDLPTAWVMAFFDGLETACRSYAVDLAGGDTVRQDQLINISISVLGQSSRPFTRRGALAGDVLMLSGNLGAAAAGLWAYRQGLYPDLWPQHWHPVPRFDVAQLLALSCERVAVLDTSDGLVRSLEILCQQNQLGCEVTYDCLPIAPELQDLARSENQLQDWVLQGGEDFELLAAVPPEAVQMLQASGQLQVIGQLISEPSMRLRRSNQLLDLAEMPTGFQHF